MGINLRNNNAPTHKVKWRHRSLWSKCDLHLVGMMSYCAKLTGEDSCDLNKIESVAVYEKHNASARSVTWLQLQ